MFPFSLTFHSFQKSFSFPLLFRRSFQAKSSFSELLSDDEQSYNLSPKREVNAARAAILKQAQVS
jgi:hypothetical protein